MDDLVSVTKFRSAADGIEVWHTLVHKAGTFMEQHAHKFPHLTVIAAGSVRVELDGAVKGEYSAPSAIMIPAGTKHLFTALEDGTAINCIHNVARRGEIELIEGKS